MDANLRICLPSQRCQICAMIFCRFKDLSDDKAAGDAENQSQR